MRPFIVFFATVILSVTVYSADLRVTVSNIDGRSGTIIGRLYAEAKGFPSDPAAAVAEAQVPVNGASAILALKGVAPGRYALIVVHDRNGDGLMEKTFLGLPEEGYGLSNNPRPLLVPRFDDAVFPILDGENAIEVGLVYY